MLCPNNDCYNFSAHRCLWLPSFFRFSFYNSRFNKKMLVTRRDEYLGSLISGKEKVHGLDGPIDRVAVGFRDWAVTWIPGRFVFPLYLPSIFYFIRTVLRGIKSAKVESFSKWKCQFRFRGKANTWWGANLSRVISWLSRRFPKRASTNWPL